MDAGTLKQWVFAAALALDGAAVAWLAWGGKRHGEQLTRLRTLVSRLDAVVEQVERNQAHAEMRLDARIDRVMNKVDGKRTGWGDSFDLTKFNWKKPDPF